MAKSKRFTLAMVIFAASMFCLAGCYHGPEKIAHVRLETVSHVVLFDKGRKHLSKEEFDSLNAFMATIPVSAISYVGMQADDANPQSVTHAKQIKFYLVKQGVDHNAIHLQPVQGGDPNVMMMTIEYAVGLPPEPCPDWSKDSAGTYNTTNASDYGCAYYADFINQLANPADFEGGQGQVPVLDADREGANVQKYRGSVAGGGASSAAR